jgi:hypothetical protein
LIDSRHKLTSVELPAKILFRLYAQTEDLDKCLSVIKTIPAAEHLDLLVFLEHRQCYDAIFEIFSAYYEESHQV